MIFEKSYWCIGFVPTDLKDNIMLANLKKLQQQNEIPYTTPDEGNVY